MDIEKLRRDLIEECLGAAFGGHFGAALIDIHDIEQASDEELLAIAERLGINLQAY